MPRLTKSKYLSGSEHVHGLGRCSDIIKRLWIIRHRHWREGRVPDEDEDGLKLWKLSEKALVKHSYCLTKVNSSVSKIALISIGLRRWCCASLFNMASWWSGLTLADVAWMKLVIRAGRKTIQDLVSRNEWEASFPVLTVKAEPLNPWSLEFGVFIYCATIYELANLIVHVALVYNTWKIF